MNIKLADTDDKNEKILDSRKRTYVGSYGNKEPTNVSYVQSEVSLIFKVCDVELFGIE